MILFVLANLYFAVFNWQIFIVKLNVNLGFGIVELPLFVVLFLFGFIIAGILSWSNYYIRLRKMIYNLEHGVEIGRLKDRASSNMMKNLIFEENNLILLKEKLGITEIIKKQEELQVLLSDMKQKSENKD